MLQENVKSAYEDFYTQDDKGWRMLSAKYKAQNIVDVCGGLKPQKVLEVGAGDGSILHYLDAWNFAPELFAIEISNSGIELMNNRNLTRLKEVRSFDGYTIPYPDKAFDLVILSHVLEHVEHERLLLRELKRVGKHVVIEVPKDYRFGVDKKMKHFLDYGHINMYTPTMLRFLLQSEGLEIMRDKVSVLPGEIVKFMNQSTSSPVKRLVFELAYGVKRTWSKVSGKKRKEQLASAYTVLTKASADGLEIF